LHAYEPGQSGRNVIAWLMDRDVDRIKLVGGDGPADGPRALAPQHSFSNT
jgi:hypothetical protein